MVRSLRLRPSKWKIVLQLAASLAFTVAGVWMMAGHGRLAWFPALFFGLCSAVFAIQLWPGASYLELLPEGFVACTLFRRWPLVRWDSVSEFRVAAVPP